MKLQFFGGADTVTGSQHLIQVNGTRILRDCGLFQGRRKDAWKINRELLYDATSIDQVILSHAHIDHCGNLPSLVRAGYEGPIKATTATVDLCDIMLRDSAYIQEQDAFYLNKKKSRKGLPPVEPLYTTEDAVAALKLFEGFEYKDTLELAEGIRMRSFEAGHILGSSLSLFELEEKGKKITVGFAVDLGRKNLPLIRDPEIMPHVDVLVMESTYGNRLHGEAVDAAEQLYKVITKTFKRGGKVLIPSFALERAQEILFHVSSLMGAGRIPKVPVYVDSPMAQRVTKVFAESSHYMDTEFNETRRDYGPILHADWVNFTPSVDESKAATAFKGPSIVIAASGMCEHGRILHH